MPAASQEQDDLDSQSVAGEEDPGASLEMFGASAGSPASGPISAPRDALNPGDEAPAGTPGTGEGICRECGGSGRVGDAPCPSCNGSGKVTVGVGGA
ncbi:Molecular chaperone DnaJ [Polaromonas hydrogenivorans]